MCNCISIIVVSCHGLWVVRARRTLLTVLVIVCWLCDGAVASFDTTADWSLATFFDYRADARAIDAFALSQSYSLGALYSVASLDGSVTSNLQLDTHITAAG